MQLPKIRSIEYGDNLKFLKMFGDESIQLIYADPQFASKREYYTDKHELAYSDMYSIDELNKAHSDLESRKTIGKIGVKW